MHLLAALLLASPQAAAAVRAEAALRGAQGLGWDIRARTCGDAGRLSEVRTLDREFEALKSALLVTHQRSVGSEIVLDDRGDCLTGADYRELAIAYRLALLDARDALGLEE